MEQTHSVLMGLDVDSLLRPFREHAGLPAPGQSLPGWYPTYPVVFGPILSALARYHLITGDEATAARVDRLVDAFAETTDPRGTVYGRDSSLYGFIVRGLLDAHRATGNSAALDALDRATVAIQARIPGHVTENASGGWTLVLPEAQFIAWQQTGRQVHLDLARRYLHEEFFDLLAAGQDCLADRNALAHVNALNGAAKAYLVLGDERHLAAARNGFAFIERQSFATGGWGPIECFLPSTMPWGEPGTPAGWMPPIPTLGASLSATHHHFQTTPGADAHFSLARYLLRITREPHYGDSIERVMYNTVLGALPLQPSGMTYYNADYHEDGRKVFFDNYGFITSGPEWPLEAGFHPLVATDYRILTYFHDDEGIFVNLYVPSSVIWRSGDVDVELEQDGAYPLDDSVALTLTVSRPAEFTVRLRIPSWAHEASVRVGGAPVGDVRPGSFVELTRVWRSGDTIDLRLPRPLVLARVDAEHPDTVALVAGPLVLFAVATRTPRFTREQLLAAVQTGPGDAEWIVESEDGTVSFRPFWTIGFERYSTYLTLS